jgi:hypothetical protein
MQIKVLDAVISSFLVTRAFVCFLHRFCLMSSNRRRRATIHRPNSTDRLDRP